MLFLLRATTTLAHPALHFIVLSFLDILLRTYQIQYSALVNLEKKVHVRHNNFVKR